MGAGTTCRQYTPTSFLSSCNESSYLKAYRDDKQKTSASYSLSTVEGIQQVSRSRQYSRRWNDAEHEKVNEMTQ